MQWVFLIGDKSLSLNSFSKMQFQDSKKIFRNEEELQIVYDNDDYAIFYKEDDEETVKSEFEPSEFEELLRKLPFDDPKWIMLKFNNIKILKKIICEKSFPKDIIIDCDGVDLGLKKVFDEHRIIGTEL